MTVAKLDRDYLANESYESNIGTEWDTKSINNWINSVGGDPLEITPDTPKVRWRLKDDDGIVNYGGWLLNDEWCIVQQAVLEWGAYDSGCTRIEVKLNNEWKQEIA